MQESDVIKLIERAIEKAGSLRALARDWGVTPSYLSDLTHGRRKPGPKILKPLGLKRVVIEQYTKV